MEKYIDDLRESPFFEGMTDEEILSILRCIGVRSIDVEKGNCILNTGETTREMEMVLTGQKSRNG